jgi:hypothetical protein
VRARRLVLTVPAAVAALLLLATPAAAAARATGTVRGVEYAATATEGRFGGLAQGGLSGAWTAAVVHDPLRAGVAVPVTGGTFTLYGHRVVTGRFVRGTVAPLADPPTCGNQRFRVSGTLALDGGGSGTFQVVLTHLRAPLRSGCTTYGATVAGSLAVPVRAVAA